ncbi:MAG: pirin family protein [Verrucomicrobiota bacterium]
MLTIRKSEERGHVKIDWLNSRHTFSFGDYYDPKHMAFHSLRVINEDHIAPASGFGAHPHRDMEILTYVVEGVLEHKDNMGNGSLIQPGEIQRMSAGTGIVHSEFNHSKTAPVHLLQIWVLPERKGLPPGYEQRTFSRDQKLNKLCLIASPDARNGSVLVNQDLNLYAAILTDKTEITYRVAAQRRVWVQVVRGSVKINEIILNAGDAGAVETAEALGIEAKDESELLLFDLAG